MACAADGTGLRGQLSQQSATQPELGQDLSPLDVDVQYLMPSILRVSIGRPDRYEVPASLFKSTMPQGECCCHLLKELPSCAPCQRSCALLEHETNTTVHQNLGAARYSGRPSQLLLMSSQVPDAAKTPSISSSHEGACSCIDVSKGTTLGTSRQIMLVFCCRFCQPAIKRHLHLQL